jgi:Fe-S cluster assembly scaffold protein SufB
MKWKVQLDNFVIIPTREQRIINPIRFDMDSYSYTIEQYAQLVYFFMPIHSVEKVKISFYVNQGSSVNFYAIMPDSVTEITLAFILKGKNAQTKVRGIYSLNGNQKLKINTVQEHTAMHTMSDLSFKGVLAGSSAVDFEGMINVSTTADYSNSRQQNKNLVLSPLARASSRPQLQIETNEVQCAHGSAIGQLDEQQLFYMNTRGIAYRQAKQLLIQSFFADILDDLPSDMVPTIEKKLEILSRNL